MNPAATLATFSDFRIVKTRKLAQFVFEVAIEDADKALAALGGLPRSDGERWCGIALITKSASPEADTGHGTAQTAGSAPVTTPSEAVAGGASRQRKPMTRAQVAGMLCRDKQFQDWLLKRWGFSEWGEDERHELAAHWVRDECAVKTRADLDRLPRAQARWDYLYISFQKDTGRIAEDRG